MTLQRRNIILIGFVALIVALILGYMLQVWRNRHQFSVVELAHINFDHEKGTVADLPTWVRALDGQRVVIAGDIYAPSDPMTAFQLGDRRSSREWSVPLVQDFIICHVAAPLAYNDDRVLVTGIFHVAIQRDTEANRVTQLYHLDVERIDPYVPTIWDFVESHFSAEVIDVAVVSTAALIAILIIRKR